MLKKELQSSSLTNINNEQIIATKEHSHPQDQFTHYTRTVHLGNQASLSAICLVKPDSNFRILKITGQNSEEALDFIQSENFYQAFRQASHWFWIAVQTDSLPENEFTTNLKFSNLKPVILEWQSSSASKIYYRNTGNNNFNEVDIRSLSPSATENIFTDEKKSFTFHILLEALKANLGGQLSNSLLTATLDKTKEFDGWRLMDYAARDSLSLRWLRLTVTDKDLTQPNSEQQRTLEIATEYATSDCVAALLNLPFPDTTAGEWFLSNPVRSLLDLDDNLGNTPLLIAAKTGNVDNLQLFIQQGADICQLNKNKKNAITLAWENKKYNAVKQLLENDSPFPNGFQEQNVDDNGLKHLVLTRKALHEALERKNNRDEIEEFVEKNPRLKRAYSQENHSALSTALIAQNYDFYAFLLSRGYAEEASQQLTEVQKQQLKSAKTNYFAKPDNSHITYLLSKSRLGLGHTNSQNHFDKIKNLYEALDDIPEISTILQVVEKSESLEIIFDFNNDSIVDIDPTKSPATVGACDYRRGRIYIGAKQELNDLRGTLAHELGHLAMQIRYHNECNPYETLEEDKVSDFKKTIEEYQGKEGVDDIIRRVFTVYRNPNDWPSELIVRVPHLWAKYGNKVVGILEQSRSLLNWYQQHIQKDFCDFIKNPNVYKAQHQILDLNQRLEQLDKLKELSKSIQLIDKRLLSHEVTNEQAMTLLFSSCSRLTLLNLYQQLTNPFSPRQSIRNLLVAQSSQLKNDLTAQNIVDVMQSDPYPLLIIDGTEASNEEQKIILSTLNSITVIQKVVLIVSTPITKRWQKFSPRKIADNAYHWQDFTDSSKEKLLEKKVIFQGDEIALQQLMTPESPITELLPLADLIEGKILDIGKPLPMSNDNDEVFYIDRTFYPYIKMKKNILHDKILCDSLSYSENEFIKLCQNFPTRNIHWLKREDGQTLVWRKSLKGLTELTKYIDTYFHNDTHPLRTYPPKDLNCFLQQAQHQKVMLIADSAGMGKSTVLMHMAKTIKKTFPTHWVFKIDLNNHTDVLKDETEKDKTGKEVETIDFLLEKLLELGSSLEKGLFKQRLKEGKVILMMDGFDEISPSYEKTVIDLLQALKKTSLEQLWVTTRPHLRKNLEHKLQQSSYMIEPFSKDNQLEFLTKFWNHNLNLSALSQNQLEIYSTALVEKWAQSIHDKGNIFMGIPLHARMLAECFKNEVKAFCDSDKIKPDLPQKLDLLDLYIKFEKEKYGIFIEEKGPLAKKQQADINSDNVSISENHQRLALNFLLTKEQFNLLQIGELEKDKKLSKEELGRIGIASLDNENKPQFIHRSFAEYFLYRFLVDNLSKLTVQNFLHTEVLISDNYTLVCTFLNAHLTKKLPPDSTLAEYGKYILELLKSDCKIATSPINIACIQGYGGIIDFLTKSLKKYPETLKEFIKLIFGEPYINNYMLLFMLRRRFTIGILGIERLMASVAEILGDDILKELLTFHEFADEMILHVAAKHGILEVVTFLIDKTNIEARDYNGMTPLQLASKYGHPKVIEFLINKEAKIEATDIEQRTPLHWAVENGLLKPVICLIEKGADIEAVTCHNHTPLHFAVQSTDCEIINLLIAKKANIEATDENNRTPLHLAVNCGHLGVVRLLLEHGANTEATFSKGSTENITPLYVASKLGKFEIMNVLIEKGANIEVIGENALHWAAEAGQLKTTELLLEKGANVFNKDDHGLVVLHLAVSGGNIELIKLVLKTIKKSTIIEEIYKAINAPDNVGDTPLMWAIAKGKTAVTELLIGSGVNLRITNYKGMTAMNWAAKGGHWEIAVTLLNHGAEIEDIRDEQCVLLKRHLEHSNYENKIQLLQLIEQRPSTSSLEQNGRY